MKSMWMRRMLAAGAVGMAGLMVTAQVQAADEAPPAQNPGGANPGGGRGGRGGGPGGAGGWGGLLGNHESATAVPGAFHVIENLVDGWRVNPLDIQAPDQVANFRMNPATVAITSLVEVTDETADKISKLSAGGEAKAKELVIKYGAKVDKLYRKRIDSAKNLLSNDDQTFLAAVLKGWDACDEATRKVTETDATKRAEELKAARTKALDEVLKNMKPEHSGRLLKVFANHGAGRAGNALEPDADLAVYWGSMRLEWDELFKPAEGDADKVKTFNEDYIKARDAEHDAFRKELQELNNKIRTDIIAALPSEQDRTDLTKIAKWSADHADAMNDLQKQTAAMMSVMRAAWGGGGGGGGAGGGQQDWQAFRQQGDELRTKMNDLRTDFEAQWPDRLKEKLPQQQGWGGQGGQGGQGGPGGQGGRGRGRGGRGGQGGGANGGGDQGGGNNAPAPGGDAGEF